MKQGVIDRAAFRKKLTDQSGVDSGTLDRIMAKAEPFFQNADAGVYRFAGASAVRKRAIGQAVRLAFGPPIKKIEIVSISSPWQKWPSAFNETVIRRTLLDFLEDGLMQLLYHRMREQHFRGLQKLLPTGDISALALEWLLQDATQRYLWRSLRKSIGDNGLWPDDLWRELYRGIHISLVCYAGYLLAGKPDEAAKLEPLIDLLPSVIPIGAKKFAQGTQIVFVA